LVPESMAYAGIVGVPPIILFPAVGSWQNLRIRANAKT
jgi:hypothetical protein